MALGTTLGVEVGSRRGSTDVLSGGNGAGKIGYYSMGEIMVSVPSYVFSGGSGEESILGESLGVIIWS